MVTAYNTIPEYNHFNCDNTTESDHPVSNRRFRESYPLDNQKHLE